jgi:hypothetical protein
MKIQQAYNFSLTDLFCEKELQRITNDPSKNFVLEGMLIHDDKIIYIENMEFPEHKLITRALENSVLFRLFQVFVEENIEDTFNVNFFLNFCNKLIFFD